MYEQPSGINCSIWLDAFQRSLIEQVCRGKKKKTQVQNRINAVNGYPTSQALIGIK